MNTYDYINDFWDALPHQWDDQAGKPLPIKDGAGRSDAQLDAWERLIGGFKLPRLFREQFKVQNGGYPKRDAYMDKSGKTLVGSPHRYEDDMIGVFMNDSHLSPLGSNYYSFREWLHNIWDDEEIAENLPGWDLDKLIIISFMYGHSLLCFDYGYRPGEGYAEPQLVCIETDDFSEDLRVPTYEHFVAGLVVFEEHWSG